MDEKSLRHFLTSYKDLISVFVIALLLGGIVLTMQLSKNQQSLQSGAFSNGVKLSMQTQKANVSSGEILTVDLIMDAKDLKVTAADIRINYSSDAFDLVSFTIPTTALLPQLLGPALDDSGSRIADTSTPGKIVVQVGSGTTAKTGVGTLGVLTLRAKNSAQTGEVSYDSMTQVAALTYNISVVESMASLPPFTISSSSISPISTDGTSNTTSDSVGNLQVQIAQPVNETIVPRTGFIPIVATINSNIESGSIQIYLDNNLVHTCNDTLTCSYNLRARRLSPGQHTIQVTATDAKGNKGSASVKVTQQVK